MRTLLLAALAAALLPAQAGKVWTIEELFRKTTGNRETANRQFPPHQVIGNIYYVGTENLASFLIRTPEGHILINSDYETTVPVIKDSVEKLGLRFNDIKILLGSHAHGDHMQGDAMVKELTGAQVMAMEQDVPALRAMTPGGKPHPVDRVLHDGDEVKLAGTTVVAHLTPGHTRGCTTWTLKATERGKTYDVVINCSVGINPGFKLVNNTDAPRIVEEFEQSYKVLRSLHCDVPLGSHAPMYNMEEKYARLVKGGPNPFIDPEGWKAELELREQVFRAELERQRKAQ